MGTSVVIVSRCLALFHFQIFGEIIWDSVTNTFLLVLIRKVLVEQK